MASLKKVLFAIKILLSANCECRSLIYSELALLIGFIRLTIYISRISKINFGIGIAILIFVFKEINDFNAKKSGDAVLLTATVCNFLWGIDNTNLQKAS